MKRRMYKLYWLFATICLTAPVDVAIGDDVDWRYRADAWGNEMGAWIYVNPKTDALTDRWCAVPKGEVTIPSSINTLPVYGIDSRAFEGCTNITSVIMPNSIVNMGSGAFERCFKLESVSFSANLTNISGGAFHSCTNLQSVTLPPKVTHIRASAFDWCYNLSHIDMSNVSRIDRFAFEGCRSLTSIYFPSSLRYVDGTAFLAASNLARIVIGNLKDFCKIEGSMRSTDIIGGIRLGYSHPCLYMNDVQLTDIIIPSGTKSIADFSVFSWCSGIRSVVIPDSVTYVGKYAFYSNGDIVDQFSYQSNSELESVVIGDGVKEIGEYAFYGCTKLTNVVMGAGVTRIGSNCFQYGGVKNFTIGANVEIIMANAFDGCSELETIIFPSTVTNIGSTVLSACFKLKAIYLPTNYTGNVSRSIGSLFESKIIRYVPEQKLTLDSNGGSVAQGTLIVKFNSAYGALPEPVRDGYVFDGWFYNGERITAQSIVRAIDDHELTAAWKPIKYAIAFDSNGGTGEMDSIWLDYDSTTNLPQCTFRYTGKVFAGWATNEVGTGTVYDDGSVVSNLLMSANGTLSLYAVWEPLVVSSPRLSSPIGSEFGTDTCLATLQCDTAGAVIYYSTNGIAPRLTQSNAYQGQILLLDTTTIKAIATLDGVLSDMGTFTVAKVPPALPTIAPADGSVFVGDECEVSICCETVGAAIYYSTDGTTPVRSEANLYRGPFAITRTTTIIAFAANDKLASECVSGTISKWDMTLADGAGASELTFTTSADAPWTPLADTTSANGYADRSGAIGMSSATWMETSVTGGGVFTFDWRVDCEHDYSGECSWDSASVYTNGVLCARIDGTTEWSSVALQFDDNSTVTHIRWEFCKDDYDEEGVDYADCVWVGCVKWTPSEVPPVLETVTINFDANGGAGGMAVSRQHGATLGPLPEPTCEGCTFMGWFTAAVGGTQVTSSTVVTADATYYAHWTKIEMPLDETSAMYCVVDLSGGANAESYPVTYLSEPPAGGFNTDEYKTDKLVLRRIEPGSFIIGEDQSDETCRVTLTNTFYCGVFEVTQRQYELVTGERPSYFTNSSCCATRPVEQVSYNMVRGTSAGAGWPGSAAVDADSFIGRLRAKTEISGFDLPTEAQWEYACRAGTTSIYNNGGDSKEDLGQLGRYAGNGGSSGNGDRNCDDSAGSAKVGSYQPNAWGLYDMHGNVWERCLDWHDGSPSCGLNPTGPSSGTHRVVRGGSWDFLAESSRSFSRQSSHPTGRVNRDGFRLVRTLGSVIDPMPEISSDSEVSGALNGFADETRLKTHLVSKAQYDRFRAWVDEKGLEHQAVKVSSRAWFSYAIGANGLVEKTFKNDDVTIRSFETTSAGVFSFEVDVKDVALGVAAVAENLATVFGIQGSASLREGAFSSKNVNVTLGVSQNNRLAVTVTPKQASKVFFIRVRMYPDADVADDEEIEYDKVQLWENGPYWATTNIGAENPEDCGYYFWWGDTVGYKRENDAWAASDGSSSNFSFEDANTVPTYGKDAATLQNEGWITADGVLAPEHDAAQVQWGGGWRMPTKQELDDLVGKCDWTWTTTNGVNGYIVRGKDNYASANIFLPAAGYGNWTSLELSATSGFYWSSVPDSDYDLYAWGLLFNPSFHDVISSSHRTIGFSIRPVEGFAE